LDIVVDGVNITARVGETQGYALLSELGHAVASLSVGRRARATAQICSDDQAWELGLEADGKNTLLSVFRAGPCPEVAVHERKVETSALARGVLDALDAALSGPLPTNVAAFLETARQQLIANPRPAKRVARQLVQDRVEPASVGSIRLSATAAFRVGSPQSNGTGADVERADLHSLLVRGRFRISAGRRSISLERAQLFLLTERMLWMAEDVLDSWQSARPVFRRVHLDGARLGVRRGPGDGPVALSVSTTTTDSPQSLTLPDLDAASFVEAVSSFATELATRITQHDSTQQNNLRLAIMLENARVLRERLDDVRADDTLTNREPDTYRSFGLPSVSPRMEGRWSQGGRMRFAPRWVATVPNVDLRSTFLCGERLLVGSSREIACLEATTGAIAWRVASDRAATVATPVGVARIHGDGRLRIHDLATGEVRSVTRLAPRAGGGAAGALVNTPGLPRMLLVAEGERCITAVDLVSGDVRWRHRSRRPASFRLRRAGKLVLVTGGDSALQALDVSTGEVVWKFRDRLPFTGDIAITANSAYAISSSAIGTARLHHLDLWTGEARWSADLDEQPVFGQAPLVAGSSVIVPTRDRRGVGALGLDAQSGSVRFEHEPGFSSPTTSWLAIEDAVVANSASGTLLCLDSESGEVRYNHVFSRHVDADQPRRLEPVLRNGALFVPQHEVQVIRPRDGEIIGALPCDLIPDLLQVDDSCNVYVAEESGHLAAFSVGAQLSLVK
jgi:outer membrane protein assembly factor BamB